MGTRRTVVAALVALASLTATASASAAGTLQPGAISQTDVGRCTLNFAYTDGASTYLGTAAHCVSAVGQEVRDADGAAFGDVAAVGNADQTATDWAFIKVRPAALGRVSPRVKGHPQYPTGVTTAAQTSTGDLLQLSGFGLGFELLPLTQEKRQGVLISDDPETYVTVAPLIFGDSGGPIVQVRTGRALGIVSRLCIGVCTEEGPTVEGILAKAAAAGLRLRLVT
jgi:hypothetical protein